METFDGGFMARLAAAARERDAAGADYERAMLETELDHLRAVEPEQEGPSPRPFWRLRAAPTT